MSVAGLPGGIDELVGNICYKGIPVVHGKLQAPHSVREILEGHS